MKARPTIRRSSALRRQLRKNQLACLLLAQGLPLILAGDEVGNTQNGNNNAYCQDNEIGWVGWEGLGREGDDLTDFIGHMTDLRRRFPQIRSHRWLDGRRADGSYGVLWLTPSADEMKEQDWNFPEGRFLAYVLGPTEHGQAPIFIVLNAAPEEIAFKLPKMPEYKNWQQVLNTADSQAGGRGFRVGKRGQGASPLGAGLCGFGMNERQFGARLTADGASFRLWAPAAKRVDLLLDKPHPMRRGDDGWFSADIAGVKAGARYKFRIDDEIDVPDPASAFQPDDVSGPERGDRSRRLPLARRRTGADGRGRRPSLLETHVGTFTPEGTYRAMIDKLDHLVATGITALELMPLADFAGPRNWGYDGVLWYAPDSAYGRPDDLKALIDEAHLRGLMVFLDVVYNHFGPEGNYLGRYAPGFFTEAQTPWGSAIDYRVPEVRAFAIENALYWLREYRFDGLRLDAVHAIAELGEISMLHDLSRAVGDLAAETGRHIHLVLENDDNAASLLDAEQDPPRGKYRAQWNDDYHHAWHVLLTGETQGYYRDYREVAAARHRARARLRLCLSGRSVRASRRAIARRAERQTCPDRLRQFPAEPRPDRQPRARRPARKQRRSRGDRSRAGDHLAGAA